MFGKRDDGVDMEGVARVVEEANRFAVNRAEAEAAMRNPINEAGSSISHNQAQISGNL